MTQIFCGKVMESSRRSVSALLREAANRLDELERANTSDGAQEGEARQDTGTPTVGRHHPVDAEVSRLFSAYTSARPRQTTRQLSRQPSRQPRSIQRYSYTHMFCCLAKKDSNFAPTAIEKERLQRAELGASRLNFQGDPSCPGHFQEFILSAFPKLKDAGGFELLRLRGSTRSRQLLPLPCPNRGYTVDYLKDPSLGINQTTIYIRPLQLSMSMEQEASDVRTEIGPQTACIVCGEEFPFSQIRQHNVACLSHSQGDNEPRAGSSGTGALTSQEVAMFEDSLDTVSAQAASSSHQLRVPSGDREHPVEASSSYHLGVSSGDPEHPVDAANSSNQLRDPLGDPEHPVDGVDAWITEVDPIKAAQLFTHITREAHKDGNHQVFNLSLLDSVEDRNRAIVSFYKRPRVQWANQLQCKLTGDAAIGDGVTRYVLSTVMDYLQTGFILDEAKGVRTLLFEGEQDHLVPSTSRELQESDMFVVAGRILGHCFLHDGPRLFGLSLAVIHVLFGGSQETATITLEDCVDQKVREVITLLEGTEILQEEEKSKVLAVSLPWDLPPVTSENRW
ncbi:uncharacterized protein LOC130908549 [Corythoichthys intestinalis]|uniref:uncharacterized protein LOC130908549 n=1 Tax=Corythoichthys intestinalis TaxID=161448 RepID=UPI0025A51BCF|nr:uncharacterized protein LOC130908549 [Corythoichthys intestinalis]